jgi:hypothetical protein
MANLASGSIISHTLEFYNNGQQNLLSLHYQFLITDGGPFTEETATDSLHSVFQTTGNLHESFADMINASITNIKTYYQPIYQLRYRKRNLGNTYSTGARTGVAAPQNLASVITLRGDFAGPNFLGNKHPGGVTTTDMTGGLFSNAFLGLMESFAINCVAPVVVVPAAGGEFRFDPVIYNRSSPNLSAYITNYAIQDSVRVMRRRTLRLGS